MHGRGAPKRAFADKVRMALGVARGMQALEEAQPPILHRDLKASNVFLDAGGHALCWSVNAAHQLHLLLLQISRLPY